MRVEELLARLGIDGPAVAVARQGVSAHAWVAGGAIVKLAREGCADDIAREVIAGPAARAAGVRTPALVASSHGDGEAWCVWERVDGEPLAEGADAARWREVGRELARLHTIDRCDDPRGVLHTHDKRDARPHLHALSPERAAWLARWLDRLERVPAGPRRLLHYDVHGLNVLCPTAGATLIDWGDSAWGDPASDLGSIPIHLIPHVLDGYEERASLGPDAEARILRTVIGHAVRKFAERGRRKPLDDLVAFVERGVPERWRRWIDQ